MEKMIEFVHNRISSNNYDTAIDFTMGNGNDTLFLSKWAKKVYSFDIQQTALDNTKKLLGDISNVELILNSHENFDSYVKEYDVGIFNLGYLPNGDHYITTKAESTLKAIDKAVKYLNSKGNLFLVVYIGHEEGKKESLLIEEYVGNLNHKDYNVALFRMMNKLSAPYVIQIEKR